MSIKVSMVSLGCSKNQIDAEIMLENLNSSGLTLVPTDAIGDVVIVNTCGFITAAKEEAIETIIELGKLKNEGKIKGIVITGCLAQRYQDDILDDMPEVNVVLGLGSNKDIVTAVKCAYNNDKMSQYGNREDLDIDGKRFLTTLPYYAYIKIAEGCDNLCTYCAIPQIRGKFRSRTIESIYNEAVDLAKNGVKELIVVAQDTTKYGIDIYKEYKLPTLLNKLCEIDGVEWIKVLYCYPDKITDELIECIKTQPKINKYLDIPIQHCSDTILKKMNRHCDKNKIVEVVEKLRSAIPNIVIRTTLITGFPGETEENFVELCEFVDEIKFERLGCFAYSAEENTKAAELPMQIDEEVKEKRASIIMDAQLKNVEIENNSYIGKNIKVIVEGYDKFGECYFGRSEFFAPEIDGKVFFTIDKNENTNKSITMGDFLSVLITDVMEYDLIGKVIDGD